MESEKDVSPLKPIVLRELIAEKNSKLAATETLEVSV